MSLVVKSFTLTLVVLLLFSKCWCLNQEVPSTSGNDEIDKVAKVIGLVGETGNRLFNSTLNDLNSLNSKEDVDTRKKIKDMQIRFARRDEMNKEDMSPVTKKIEMAGCRNIEITQVTYIL